MILQGVLIKLLSVRQDNHKTRIASLMNVDETTFSLRCLDSCSFIKTFSPFCLGDFHGKLQCLMSDLFLLRRQLISGQGPDNAPDDWADQSGSS